MVCLLLLVLVFRLSRVASHQWSLAAHGPQECDCPAGSHVPLYTDKVVAAFYNPRHPVPHALGRGDNLVLKEEQSAPCQEKEAPCEGIRLHLPAAGGCKLFTALVVRGQR